eukprot:Lithocolla_globosa_v1_NODE_130_length_5959_cov_143.867209.p2 type:complete len:150 gc:universal NODE_130_length_5959_cov_143.867209:480-929(+)
MAEVTPEAKCCGTCQHCSGKGQCSCAVCKCDIYCRSTRFSVRSLSPKTVVFSVEGMTCSTCTGQLESQLGKMTDILDVKASFVTGSVVIQYIPSELNLLDLKEAIESCGFDAEIAKTEKDVLEVTIEGKSLQFFFLTSVENPCGKPVLM